MPPPDDISDLEQTHTGVEYPNPAVDTHTFG